MDTVNHLWNMFHPTDPRHRTEALPSLLSAFDFIAKWMSLITPAAKLLDEDCIPGSSEYLSRLERTS